MRRDHILHDSAFGSYFAFALFTIPFILLALTYRNLPSELVVLRFINHWERIAPKSPLMIFRVPLMNLIHGIMAGIMLSYARAFSEFERRRAYARVFITLIYAVAIKSIFEGLEMSALVAKSTSLGHSFAFGTVASVGIGVTLAIWHSRKVPLPWPELKIRTMDKFMLIALFSFYAALVTISIVGSHQVSNA